MQGYWSTDAKGDYLGVVGGQTFRFTSEKTRHGYRFQAYRTRLDSGKETRVARMSGSKLTKDELVQNTKAFMVAVVNAEL